MCKGPGAELKFYKASVAAVWGRKGLLEQSTGMEMAEAGRWAGDGGPGPVWLPSGRQGLL